jgi:protein-L-isoaspartate(D-aspartate) O-methyltransferase
MRKILTALAITLMVLSAAPVIAQETGDSARTRARRDTMVRRQIERRGVARKSVLAAMRAVPRHLFVPPGLADRAYNDYPLPIGQGQTISQPYIVALMTELLNPPSSARVLEIGTGSGYQAAVLSVLCEEVYTMEIKEALHKEASERLRSLGYTNVHTRFGDGYYGWEDSGPFDGIMITAAVDHIPPPLLAQLRDGGRMVLPLGDPYGLQGQTLVVVTRSGEQYTVRQVLGVRFVPMTGRAQTGQ